MDIKQIQKALKKAGFDPGPVDGIRGRRTIAAIKAFQQANSLDVDGIVGPKTAAKLLGKSIDRPLGDIPHSMPWLQEAFHLIGTLEEPGAGSNEAILGWAKALRIDYREDEIPWCGLFAAHCTGSQLTEEPLPTIPLRARAWEKFGVTCKPQLGAVMVFWRKSKGSGLGHVGFYWAEDDSTYHILGGNQSDEVRISRYKKNRFLQARWPKTALSPDGIVRKADARGRLLAAIDD